MPKHRDIEYSERNEKLCCQFLCHTDNFGCWVKNILLSLVFREQGGIRFAPHDRITPIVLAEHNTFGIYEKHKLVWILSILPLQ